MTKKFSRVPATVFNAFVSLVLAPYAAMALVGGFGSEYWGWLAIAFAALVYPVVNLLALWLPGTPRRPSWHMTKKICRIVAIGLNALVLLCVAGAAAQILGGGLEADYRGLILPLAFSVYPAVNLLALLFPDTP